MIEQQDMELINRAVDGELDADEQASLERLLAGSAEARQLFAELRDLDSVLDKLPQQELPAGLHADIVQSIELPAQRAGATQTAWPAALRYGLAASVGLMIAVGFYEGRPDGTGPEDFDNMVGTIARPSTEAASQTGGITLDADGLTGRAQLRRRDDADILELDWASDDAIDILIDLRDSGLRLEAVGRLSSELEAFSVVGQTLRLRGAGRQQFTARLQRNSSAGADDAIVTLDFLRDGALVQQGRLTIN